MPSNTPEYARKYQSNIKNKKRYNKLQKQRRLNLTNKNRLLVNAFKSKPCLDCGNNYPIECMDFDHINGEKLYNVSKMVHHCSTNAMLNEIAKCEVVCANCHRIRTAKRRNGRKWVD
jgi:hypothetical protein